MFVCGVAAVRVEAADPASGQVIDVCHAQSIPNPMVGKIVSIRGHIHSDVESSWIYDNACPDAIVRLRYRALGPSLISCLTGFGHSRCGGLSRNEQLAVAEGILTEKRDRPPTLSRGLPFEVAAVEVTKFWASTNRLPSCEKDIQPLKTGAAVSPIGEAARHPPGRVLLTFLINASGSVSNVKVIHSSDDWYDSSAVDLVKRFKFSPRSSPCQGHYTVRFTLQ